MARVQLLIIKVFCSLNKERWVLSICIIFTHTTWFLIQVHKLGLGFMFSSVRNIKEMLILSVWFEKKGNAVAYELNNTKQTKFCVKIRIGSV